jgi:hypothetical protein
MPNRPTRVAFGALGLAALAVAIPLMSPLCAQGVSDPMPEPIASAGEPITVGIREFVTLPDVGGIAPRMMLLEDEPVTSRLFVNEMQGPLFTVSYDGATVREYLNVDEARWGVPVQSQGRERGFQSFALHPQFAEPGTPGYGKLYTWVDTENTTPAPDFRPGGGGRSHDTVLLEWTARSHTSATYDGEAPREILRIEQPFANHNAGRTAFNPFARSGSPDYGLLYVNLADGGSGGDPLNNAQSLTSPFGKILRIDPLGRNSANGKYGIPERNPFEIDNNRETLGEIFAYGLRNPQHIAWDRTTGRMFVTDIGQGTIEELNYVTGGDNLGWNVWEGSYRFVEGGVSSENPRSDARVTYPIAEYDQTDPVLGPRVAVTGLAVYRESEIPELAGRILWGDLPSGEMFSVPADHLPYGGQSAIRRVLFRGEGGGEATTLLALIRERNAAQGRSRAERADLRFYPGNEGRVYLLNKWDGVIRVLVP